MLEAAGEKTIVLGIDEAVFYLNPDFQGSTKEETTTMLNQIAEDARANGKVLISIDGLPITLIPFVPMKGLTADENVKIITALIVSDEVYSEYVNPDTVTVYHNFCIPSETVEADGLMVSIMEARDLLKPLLFIAEFCRRNKKKGLNMKVITMESSAYKEMMAQIANIAGYIREARDEKKRKRETEDKLLDTAQAAKMLNVSKRTMQRMRTDHRIEYVVVRGSCRYRLSEILRLLEDNTVRNEEGTIDTLFHNHTLRTGGKPKGRRT